MLPIEKLKLMFANEIIRCIKGKYNWQVLAIDADVLNLDNLVITKTSKTPFERINMELTH